jgi:hypothetical protein
LFLFSCIVKRPLTGASVPAACGRPGKYVTNSLRFSAQALDSATIIGLQRCGEPQKWRK